MPGYACVVFSLTGRTVNIFDTLDLCSGGYIVPAGFINYFNIYELIIILACFNFLIYKFSCY